MMKVWIVIAAIAITLVLGFVVADALTSSFANTKTRTDCAAPEKTTLVLSQETDQSSDSLTDKTLDETLDKTPVTTTTKFNKQLGFRNVFVYVDSNAYDPSTGRLKLTFDLKNVLSFELYAAAIPKGSYVIQLGINDSFDFTANASTTRITIPKGDYDAETLAAAVQTAVQQQAGVETFACSYERLTTSLVFQSEADAFSLSFDEGSFLKHNLGLGTATEHTSTIVNGVHTLAAAHRVDLFGSRYLKIEGDSMRKHYIDSSSVATVHLADEINYTRGHADMIVRDFPVPIKRWREVTLTLYEDSPFIPRQIFNPNGLGFHLTFVARVMVQKLVHTYENIDY